MIVIHSLKLYKNIMKLLFIVAVFVPFSLIAQIDNYDIKKVIISYNQGIIKAARTSKTDHMKSFAKEDIVKKFHLWIKSWHDNNLFMDAKIKDISFKNLEVKNSKAKVTTREEWIYKYIDIKTKKQVKDLTDIVYVVKYTLLYENNRWIIEKIDVVSEK